jgi:hypothetical protein
MLVAAGSCASSNAASSTEAETAPPTSGGAPAGLAQEKKPQNGSESALNEEEAEDTLKNIEGVLQKEDGRSKAAEGSQIKDASPLAKIKGWKQQVALQAHACWAGFDCASVPGPLPQTVSAPLVTLLMDSPNPPKDRLLHIAAVSELLTDAGRSSLEQAREQAELSFVESESPFLLADLPRLLLNSSRSGGRMHLLHALPALEKRVVLDARRWTNVEQLAEKLNRSVPSLLALRVGLSPEEIQRVAADFLAATDDITAGENLSPVDIPRFAQGAMAELSWEKGLQGVLLDLEEPDRLRTESRFDAAACFLIDPPKDVRFVAAQIHNGASLLSTVYARGCMTAGKLTPQGALPSFLFVHAVSLLAQETMERNKQQRENHYWSRIVSLRGLALTAGLTMDEALGSIMANHGQLDKIAKRQTMSKSEVTPGASFFLQLRPDGSHLDAFFAYLLAGVMDTRLNQQLGVSWETKHQDRDAILEVLQDVEKQLRQGGLQGAFGFIGETEITHGPALQLWRRFRQPE